LVNADLDPDPRQKITKFISNHPLKVKKKKIFLNLYLNLRDKLLFSFRLENYNFLQKNPKKIVG